MGFLIDLLDGTLTYETWKIIHLFGIMIFMGNIIITGWWKVMADRTRDPAVVAFAQRQVTVTDFLFTAGGATIVLLAGFGMVSHMSDGTDSMRVIYDSTWLNWGYWLFVASGIIWVLVLIPVQIIQARMAHEFARTGIIPARYWQLGWIWGVFGLMAILLPLKRFDILLKHDNMSKRPEPFDGVSVSRSHCVSS